MKTIYKVFGTLIVLALVVFIGSRVERPASNTFGSVGVSGEYHSTTTYNNGVTSLTNRQVLQSGPGTFGSVIITGAVAGALRFYDATSTVTNTEWATTTLAIFPASAAAGTYTFDSIFQKGLMIEYTAGLVPTTTITYR